MALTVSMISDTQTEEEDDVLSCILLNRCLQLVELASVEA